MSKIEYLRKLVEYHSTFGTEVEIRKPPEGYERPCFYNLHLLMPREIEVMGGADRYSYHIPYDLARIIDMNELARFIVDQAVRHYSTILFRK